MSLSSSSILTVRAAAVLTGSAVASSVFAIPQSASQRVNFIIDFTLGSLTNGIFTPQVSPDGSNWYDAVHPGALTLTADGQKAISVDCAGAKLVRMTVKGTGTVTGSSATVKLGYQRT